MATPTRSRKTTRSQAGAEESLLRAPGTYIFFGAFGGLRYYPPRAIARSGRQRVLVGVQRTVALRRSTRCPSFILPSRAGGLCWRRRWIRDSLPLTEPSRPTHQPTTHHTLL